MARSKKIKLAPADENSFRGDGFALSEWQQRRNKVLALAVLGFDEANIAKSTGLSPATIAAHLRAAKGEFASEWKDGAAMAAAYRTACLGAYQKLFQDLEEEKRRARAEGRAATYPIDVQVKIVDAIARLTGANQPAKLKIDAPPAVNIGGNANIVFAVTGSGSLENIDVGPGELAPIAALPAPATPEEAS